MVLQALSLLRGARPSAFQNSFETAKRGVSQGYTRPKYSCLEVSGSQKVAVVTLNRLAAKNSLSKRLLMEFNEAVQIIDKAPGIRALIITGKGNVFSAGADLTVFLDPSPTAVNELLELADQAMETIEKTQCITVAALNGMTLGGGAELALRCQFRIASQDASIGFPEVKLGALPGCGGTQFLPQLIGGARAQELILSGRVMDAREAEQVGFVSKLFPPGDFIQQAVEYVAGMAWESPTAVAAIHGVMKQRPESFERGLKAEREAFFNCVRTPEFKDTVFKMLNKTSRQA